MQAPLTIAIPLAVAANDSLTATDKLIYGAIVSCPERPVTASNQWLADLLHVHSHSIPRSLQKLMNVHYVMAENVSIADDTILANRKKHRRGLMPLIPLQSTNSAITNGSTTANDSVTDQASPAGSSSTDSEAGESAVATDSEADDGQKQATEPSKQLSPFAAPIQTIVTDLNNQVDRDFLPSDKRTQQLIIRRLKQGYTVGDFHKVITSKAQEWLTDFKMIGYLRPSTLFGKKFEDYLATAESQYSHGLLRDMHPLTNDQPSQATSSLQASDTATEEDVPSPQTLSDEDLKQKINDMLSAVMQETDVANGFEETVELTLSDREREVLSETPFADEIADYVAKDKVAKTDEQIANAKQKALEDANYGIIPQKVYDEQLADLKHKASDEAHESLDILLHMQDELFAYYRNHPERLDERKDV